MNGNRAILVAGLLLVVAVVVFETTSLDLLVQDRLYDPVRGWCISRDAPVPKLIFYEGPKVIIGVIGAFLVLCVAVPASKSAKLPFSRREAAFLLVCIGLIPLTAGVLKKTTGVFGPWKIARYGGEQPYRTLFESIPHVPGQARGYGFPAAHCSGAFALVGLYFVGKTRRARWLGLSCGLAAGWTVGIYQMLKGAHYLSHTVVTMIVAWLMVQLLARAFGLGGAAPPEFAAN